MRGVVSGASGATPSAGAPLLRKLDRRASAEPRRRERAARYSRSERGCASKRIATERTAPERSAPRDGQAPSLGAASLAGHPIALPEPKRSSAGLGGGWRVDGIALTWSDRSHQGGPREAAAAPGERTRQTG